jgi:ATP-binding cassette subfamily F protein uup
VVADVIVLGDGRAERRPGGYAAYEEDRRRSRRTGRTGSMTSSATSARTAGGATGAAPPPIRAAVEAAPRPSPGTSPSTLRHRLRAAERELEQCRVTAERLRADLVGAGASGDHTALTRLGHELSEAESRLGATEEAWLELATEVEERGLDI